MEINGDEKMNKFKNKSIYTPSMGIQIRVINKLKKLGFKWYREPMILIDDMHLIVTNNEYMNQDFYSPFIKCMHWTEVIKVK